MRRLARFVIVSGALLALVVGPTAALAQAPLEQGWWTTGNPGSVEGSPTPPAPPDVPAKGLLVQGGSSSASGASNTGPTSYAGLVYLLPDGALLGPLTLNVASGSATTPNSTL